MIPLTFAFASGLAAGMLTAWWLHRRRPVWDFDEGYRAGWWAGVKGDSTVDNQPPRPR